MTEYWIQEAIKRPGALREWLERHRSEVKRLIGEDPFTEDGKIRMSALRKLKKRKDVLKKIAKSRWRTIHKRVVLAVTLKRMK